MDITIENLQKKIPLNPNQIKKITKKILQAEGVQKAVLSIVFVTSQKIRALNKKFLRRSYATDVLAFDLSGNGMPVKLKPRSKTKELVGDVIISTDAAKQNSKKYKTPLEHEVTLYVVHGILHLLGYDDHAPKDIKKMRKKEEELMDFLGKEITKVID